MIDTSRNLNTTLGQRIKYYRNYRNISQQTLASIINKSFSTVSKYEAGTVSIDIATLYDIADALSVSMHQLIPDTNAKLINDTTSLKTHFFMSNPIIYMYYLADKDIVESLLKVHDYSENTCFAHVFIDIAKPDDYTLSKFYSAATITCYDGGASIILDNPINNCDHGYISAKLPFSTQQAITGIFTFTSEELGQPVSLKTLFSAHPLKKSNELIDLLSLNKREITNELKKRNIFIAY